MPRVQGVGPLPCDLMLVGEGSGAQESATGTPFVETAPAGAELTRYCNGITLPTRDEVYITNLVKEWGPGLHKKKQDVTPEDVARDEWELRLELVACQPKVVVALGRHAARWFLGPCDMEAIHGLVFRILYCNQCGIPVHQFNTQPSCPCPSDALVPLRVVPVYHPAAGLHQPDLAAKTAYDLDQVKGAWAGTATLWMARGLGQYLDGENGMGLGVVSQDDWGIDTEGTPDSPFCFSISPAPGHGYVKQFYPLLQQPTGQTIPLALTASHRWVFHNFMWDSQVLGAAGITVPDDAFDDTMVMAYLLGVEPQGLKDLALRHLGLQMTEFTDIAQEEVPQYSTKTGKLLKKTKKVIKPLGEIPWDTMVQYAGADPDATLQLKSVLWPRVVQQGLEQVYEMDRSVLPMYARMEQVGLPVDMGYYQQFSAELEQRLDEMRAGFTASWPDLNPDAPAQVGHILFSHLGLPGGKKTPKSGQWCTDDKILQTLKGQHPFVDAIIDYREIAKLKSTFIDSLPGHVGPDGRLRYRVLPTRVVSGRVAAKEPNVLALPKHSELGKRFRRGVVATPGRLLGSWDFNQIELRVLAVDSGSEALQQMFRDGVDLHTRTASRIFGVPDDRGQQDDSLHRLPAKTTNFSLIMGTTEHGLAEQMRKFGYPFPELHGQGFGSLKERYAAQGEVCRQWIDTVLDDWGVREYIRAQHQHAKKFGYVRDMWGRRRWLPSVLSPNKQIREGALRQAQAFGPQAGARGIYKQCVARVWREVIRPLREQGQYVEPLADFHDDLFLEFDAELGELLGPVIKSYFETTVDDLPIPIVCSAKVGVRWSDL